MEWQAIVLTIQIMLLAVGWFLFQQAKAELNARAAETPVLKEVKALQRNVAQLLTDLEKASEEAGSRLEEGCRLAQEFSRQLDIQRERLEEAQANLATLPAAAVPLTRLTLVHDAQPVQNGLSSEGYGDRSQDEMEPIRAVAGQSRLRPVSVAEEVSYTTAATLAAPTSALPVVRDSPRVALRQRVYTMADDGQSAAAIARVTGVAEGEIETLLGLRAPRS